MPLSLRVPSPLNSDSGSRELNSYFAILNQATNKVNSPSRAFFAYIDEESNKILSHKIYEGHSVYKEFNLFITNTLIALKEENKPTRVHVPGRFLSNKTIEIWASHGIEIIGFDSITTPALLRLFISTARYSNLTSKTTDEEFKDIINRVNNILKDLKLKRRIKVFKSRVAKVNGIIKRSYSTLISSLGYSYMKFIDYEKNTVFNETTVNNKFNDFWDKYIAPEFSKNPNAKIALQFRGLMGLFDVRSFSSIDIVAAGDKLKMGRVYRLVWNFRTSYYNVKDVNKIIFGYKILDDNIKTKYPSCPPNLSRLKESLLKDLGSSSEIPKNMDVDRWGPVVEISSREYISIKDKYFATVIKEKGKNIVTVYVKALGTLSLVATFTDSMGEDLNNLTTFKRVVNKNLVISYINGEVSQTSNILENIKYIPKSVTKSVVPSNKIITMDFETKEIRGDRGLKMEVVCASIYSTGMSKVLNFKIWDYSSSQLLIESAIKSLLIKKYSGYTVYFHNFGKFDSPFLMNCLACIPDIKLNIIRRNGILIRVNIQYDKTIRGNKTVYKSSITILDSLNILPLSLEKLGKCFGSEFKGMFPLKILNDPNISLNYEGDVPPIKYFYQPSLLNQLAYNSFLKKYMDYKRTFEKNGLKWNLKDELVKYCEQDVITLHNVLIQFTKLIYEKFDVNILKLPTLPSIAFKLYRHKFMSNSYIPIIIGDVYKRIKEAYYGGFVDVYRSFAKNIVSFDVNSLYPFSMLSKPMPIGAPEVFEFSDYRELKSLPNLFGFVYAKIETPRNLNTPILPFKVKSGNTSNGQTIYPLGTFEGWYFTEELKNAAKYGYNIKIIRGYKFKKDYLFIDYVNTLYSIKNSVKSDSPLYTISKLLMNSLYGRFGMDPILPQTDIINSKEELDKIISNFEVLNIDTWGETILVTYIKNKTPLKTTYVSIPVAAAIASYSRIHMTQFIIKYSNVICAIDTDGIKITSELDSKYVGTELGMMKREYEFKEGCFIAPKVYGGITTTGKMIVKAKGVKVNLSYWNLKSLLWGEQLKIDQQKWYRDYGDSTIYIKDEVYSLIPTENKREIIWDSCGYFVGTVPFELKDGTIVNTNPPVLHYLPAPRELLSLPPPEQLLYISAPDSYLALKAPIEEENIIYILPTVFYMGAPLPSVIRLPESSFYYITYNTEPPLLN